MSIWLDFNFIDRKPYKHGYQYDVTCWERPRKRGVHLTTILPFWEDGKKRWILFGREAWGHFKTRKEAAREAAKRIHYDPDSDDLEATFHIRSDYPIGRIPEDLADEIYTIVVEECGASDRQGSWDRPTFVNALTDRTDGEYRFSGWLGFGGKVYWNSTSVWVSNYPEDRHYVERNMMAHANSRIQKLLRERYGDPQ